MTAGATHLVSGGSLFPDCQRLAFFFVRVRFFPHFPTFFCCHFGYNGATHQGEGGQAVPGRGLVRNRRTTEYMAGCALRFLLCALLVGAQLRGGYMPFALGFMAAAGAGSCGLFALLGALAGAWLFLDFSQGLRFLAAALLLYTASNAFAGAKVAERRLFWPLMTAGLTASVETVYLLQTGVDQAAYLLLSLCLCALAASAYRTVLSGRPEGEQQRLAASLLAAIGVLTALASVQTKAGFAPGRAVAMLFVMSAAYRRGTGGALSTALCVGLAMDLSAQNGVFLYAGVYGAAAAMMNLRRRGRRTTAALLFLLPTVLLALGMEAQHGLVLLYEGSLAALVFLAVPQRWFSAHRQPLAPADAAQEEATERSTLRRSLEQSAAAYRELYDCVAHAVTPEDENPSSLFDRAAEQVCSSCPHCAACWQTGYARTFSALNAAAETLLRHGRGKAEDFPQDFTDRCVRFPRFLEAVNAELSAYLLRRQYRSRLRQTQTQAAAQYAQVSELLHATAGRLDAPAFSAQRIPYHMGLALRPKEGEAVSGDTMTHFETETGELCLLLSDGMGCGDAARRESALAVRLTERLLCAGIAAPVALKTLNSAFTLRAETSGSFTTLDLAVLSLRTGETAVYKYGAAPSYIKKNGRVRRIRAACLPAGLQRDDSEAEATRVRLERGCFFVMVSDGVADANDDEWLQDLLAGWTGTDPQQLTSAILADSRTQRGGADDASVLAVYLDEEGAV